MPKSSIPRILSKEQAREIVSKERARQIKDEIWKSHGWDSKSMTPVEERAIKDFWNGLSGTTTFFDAVRILSED